jgi:hypothetical protein
VGGPGPDRQEIRAKLEKISAELNLTPQQKLQLLPILKEEAPELKAVKGSGSFPRWRCRTELHPSGATAGCWAGASSLAHALGTRE